MVTNMDMKPINDKFTCEICNKRKIHQLPYKDSVNRSRSKLDLVHSDICGPFNVESIGGARYFAKFIDDYTRYTQTVMLKKRSDIFIAFKTIRNESRKKLAVSLKNTEQTMLRNMFQMNSKII